MSTTARVAQRAHSGIQRVGARPGALHAALWMLDGEPTEAQPVPAGHWRTACGEDLRDGPRGHIVTLSSDDVVRLIEAHPERICRRCDRVGESVE